jgi:uncharacterized protein YoxC
MPPVQLSPLASTFLVAFYVLTSLILVILLGAVVLLVLKLNTLLVKYEQKIDPLLDKADRVLTTTTEKVNIIGTKAEEILNQGEELTEMVHSRVDTTTYAVQRTVFTPLIGVNSLLAGIRSGARTFATRQQQTIQEVVQKEAAQPVQAANPAATVSNTAVKPAETQLERKNSPDVDQTTNLSGAYSVNSMVSNGAEPQLVTVGSRKENS